MSRESNDGFVCPKCDETIYREQCACTPVDPLDELLARCFAVYQATPVVIATPPILVGKRIAEKGF